MPPGLDPGLRDNDFGRFIHAVPGVRAAHHGLEAHSERALGLRHAATKRFSMEFYIRPFLNRWLEMTLARFVTRSVANHLNDIAKTDPDAVLERLHIWRASGAQSAKEHDRMRRHGLRTLIKSGDPGAMQMLGLARDVPVDVKVEVVTPSILLGDPVEFMVTVQAEGTAAVLIDDRVRFARPGGPCAEKVFKLKIGQVASGRPLVMRDLH